MKITIRFDDEELKQIEDFKKEQGFKDRSKAVRFLVKSSLDKRTYNRRGAFIRCLNGLFTLSDQIRKVGINLNQLVALYAQGKVPNAGDMPSNIQELQSEMAKSTALLSELSNTIVIND